MKHETLAKVSSARLAHLYRLVCGSKGEKLRKEGETYRFWAAKADEFSPPATENPGYWLQFEVVVSKLLFLTRKKATRRMHVVILEVKGQVIYSTCAPYGTQSVPESREFAH